MKSYKKEICYPIFLKVAQLSSDTFWNYLYEDMAYGITPFGTYIDKDAIYCRFKGKQFNFNFKNKSCEEINKQLTHILKSKLNICSKIDHLSKREKFDIILKNSSMEWKNIKKKNIKDILIENFVIRGKYDYDLTISQTQRILRMINIAFYFKLIANSDIEYDSDKCEIKNIKGIDFQSLKNKKFSVTSHTLPKLDLYENQSIVKQKMSDLWSKYINAL